MKGNPEESSLYFSSSERETTLTSSALPESLHWASPLIHQKGWKYNFHSKGNSNKIRVSSFSHKHLPSQYSIRKLLLFFFFYSPFFLLLLRYFCVSDRSLCVLWECFCLRRDMQPQSTSVCTSSHQTLCEHRLDFDKALLTDPVLNLNEKQFFWGSAHPPRDFFQTLHRNSVSLSLLPQLQEKYLKTIMYKASI